MYIDRISGYRYTIIPLQHIHLKTFFYFTPPPFFSGEEMMVQECRLYSGLHLSSICLPNMSSLWKTIVRGLRVTIENPAWYPPNFALKKTLLSFYNFLYSKAVYVFLFFCLLSSSFSFSIFFLTSPLLPALYSFLPKSHRKLLLLKYYEM